MSFVAAGLCTLLLLPVPALLAADAPQALVAVEGRFAPLPYQMAEQAPPLFLLFSDGTVFVGGSQMVLVAKLPGDELKAIERQVKEVRKLPLVGEVTVGPGSRRHRVFLARDRPIDMVVIGDPERASGTFAPLGRLLDELTHFTHPALRPYEPAQLSVRAKEGVLPGGCRPWRHTEPVARAVFAPILVPAGPFETWPKGAVPAAVCSNDDRTGKRFVVTLRPVIPGEPR